MRSHDLMALFRRHSSVPEIVPVQQLKQIFHRYDHSFPLRSKEQKGNESYIPLSQLVIIW